jgi:transcriptional regulator
MYVPKHFEVTDVSVMHDLIRKYPLATLVTHSQEGLNANHIPLHLTTSSEPYGTLHGHVSRINPLLTDIIEGSEELVIFHGPNAYISPSWYETKKQTGKVVPTWNYLVVHAYGKIRINDDCDWLLTQLNNLTDFHEVKFLEPWTVSEAPNEFTEKLLESIIGIEMKITKLIGKWKVSQNQPEHNKQSVINGLNSVDATSNSKIAEYIKAEMKSN